MNLQLRKATEQDLHTVITWFTSEEEAKSWGGPRIRFPLHLEQLLTDIEWGNAGTWSLTAGGKLLGFAQEFCKKMA